MIRIGLTEITPEVRLANMFDAGKVGGWGPRKIADPELVLVVSGELRQRRGGEEVAVRAGEVLLILPGVEHVLSVRSPERRTVISCIHFEPVAGSPFRDGAYALDPQLGEVTSTDGDYMVRDLFTKLASVFEGHSRYRDYLMSAMFRELWIRLAEFSQGGARTSVGPRMNSILSFIRRNLSSDLSRARLASELDVTPQYVNALFRKELGMTPSECVNRERVYRGSRLIVGEGLSVKEAAAAVGFKDQFYFSRDFKRVMKYPPSRSA